MIGVVTLSSIIVLNLSQVTILNEESLQQPLKRLKAEYLLKSALSVASVIIALPSPTGNERDEPWREFMMGIEIPPSYIQVAENNIRVSLEISPEERKLPISLLKNQTVADFPARRDIFLRLFQNLGFDVDQQKDLTPQFSGRIFTASEMVANLIDFIDADTDPYSASGFQGVESANTAKSFQNALPARVEDMGRIPGFTPTRLRALTPYISTANFFEVNPNYAGAQVMRAIDPDLSPEDANKLLQATRGPDGPFNITSIRPFFPNVGRFDSLLKFKTDMMTIIAKVEYDGTPFYLKALATKATGSVDITETQIY